MNILPFISQYVYVIALIFLRPFNKKSGTIKHIYKSTLWLHSAQHMKDSGIFVVRSRSCIVAGAKGAAALGSSGAAGGGSGRALQLPSQMTSSAAGARGVRDPSIGMTTIRKNYI